MMYPFPWSSSGPVLCVMIDWSHSINNEKYFNFCCFSKMTIFSGTCTRTPRPYGGCSDLNTCTCTGYLEIQNPFDTCGKNTMRLVRGYLMTGIYASCWVLFSWKLVFQISLDGTCIFTRCWTNLDKLTLNLGTQYLPTAHCPVRS